MENQAENISEKVRKAMSIFKVTNVHLKLKAGLVTGDCDTRELAREVFLKIIANDNAYGCNKFAMLRNMEKKTGLSYQEFVSEKDMLGAFLYFLNLQIKKGHRVTTAELEWVKNYFASKYYLNRAKKNLYMAAVIIYGQDIIETGFDWEVSERTMRNARKKRFEGLLANIDKLDRYGLEKTLAFSKEFRDQKSQLLIRKKLLSKYLWERDYEKAGSLNCSEKEILAVAPSVVSGYVNTMYLDGAREIAEKFVPNLVVHVDTIKNLFKKQ